MFFSEECVTVHTTIENDTKIIALDSGRVVRMEKKVLEKLISGYEKEKIRIQENINYLKQELEGFK